jgi:hypothetical protein
MTTTVATRDDEPGAELLERVVIGGDLSKLTPAERLRYYRDVCASVGLNPLTKPFEYLHLNAKLVLYARRDATDQLRKLHGVSITITGREQHGDVYAVVARATGKDGRTDEAIGAVATGGLKGDALANALMKAETKSKRRVTLSICGLGMLDETEVDTIPEARLVRPEALDERGPDAPTPPRPGGASPPLADWLTAMAEAESRRGLQDLWTGLTAPALWSSWSPAEQVQLTAAKNAAKQRLGVDDGPAR